MVYESTIKVESMDQDYKNRKLMGQLTPKEQVMEKILELEEQVKKGKASKELLDGFYIGFATGSNFEASYHQGTNYDSLAFWGKLCGRNDKLSKT